MRDRYARLDNALIDEVFQPLVTWIAQHLAFDCFRVARFCTDLSAFAWVLSQADGAITTGGSGNPAPAVYRIALIILGLGAIMVLRTLFQRVGGGGGAHGGSQPNPLRAGMHMHRFTCLFWLVGLSIKTATAPATFAAWALLAVGVFATIAMYFSACSNPPPKRRDDLAQDRGWKLAALPLRG